MSIEILGLGEKIINSLKLQQCSKCKKVTDTSIHGRCLDCGEVKFDSSVLMERAARLRTKG